MYLQSLTNDIHLKQEKCALHIVCEHRFAQEKIGEEWHYEIATQDNMNKWLVSLVLSLMFGLAEEKADRKIGDVLSVEFQENLGEFVKRITCHHSFTFKPGEKSSIGCGHGA